MKERFGAKKPESMRLRFHCQTAGGVLHRARAAQQHRAHRDRRRWPRCSGGAQSLHTNGYDEAFAIPTEEAMKIALRTQQIIAEETGVAGTIDALAGSYAVERLTADIERACFDYFDEIDRRGGVVKCIEDNFFQLEIANAAYDLYLRKERHEFEFVGVTKYRDDSGNPAVELHHVDEAAANRQLARLAATKSRRDQAAVDRALGKLVAVARTDENVMPATIDAVRVRATEGEIINALKPIFGVYVEKPVF